MPDFKNFTLDIDADGIALVTWDMPGKSMNVIDESVIEELDSIASAALNRFGGTAKEASHVAA